MSRQKSKYAAKRGTHRPLAVWWLSRGDVDEQAVKRTRYNERWASAMAQLGGYTTDARQKHADFRAGERA